LVSGDKSILFCETSDSPNYFGMDRGMAEKSRGKGEAMNRQEMELQCQEQMTNDANWRVFSNIAEQYAAACVTEATEKSSEFKKYVHKRLDDAGIPVDPESPHKAAGCRVGGRLDWFLSGRDKLRAALEAMAKNCRCRGTGKYQTNCTLCGDSTFDHECNDRTVACEKPECVAARAILGRQ
jgi:hypothetical protein